MLQSQSCRFPGLGSEEVVAELALKANALGLQVLGHESPQVQWSKSPTCQHPQEMDAFHSVGNAQIYRVHNPTGKEMPKTH